MQIKKKKKKGNLFLVVALILFLSEDSTTFFFSQPRALIFSSLARLLSTVLLPNFCCKLSIVLFSCSMVFVWAFSISKRTLNRLIRLVNKSSNADWDFVPLSTCFAILSNCFWSSFKSTLKSLICLDTAIISKPYFEDLWAKSESSTLYRE